MSGSGQTAEVTARHWKPCSGAAPDGLAVTDGPDSPLAVAAQSVLALAAGPERARVATKTVTAQLLALALLARALDPRGHRGRALAAVAGQVADVLADIPAAAMAAELSVSRGVVCLADGALQVAAQDAAEDDPGHGGARGRVHVRRIRRSAAVAPGLAPDSRRSVKEACRGSRRWDAEAVIRRGATWFGLSPQPDAAVRLPGRSARLGAADRGYGPRPAAGPGRGPSGWP